MKQKLRATKTKKTEKKRTPVQTNVRMDSELRQLLEKRVSELKQRGERGASIDWAVQEAVRFWLQNIWIDNKADHSRRNRVYHDYIEKFLNLGDPDITRFFQLAFYLVGEHFSNKGTLYDYFRLPTPAPVEPPKPVDLSLDEQSLIRNFRALRTEHHREEIQILVADLLQKQRADRGERSPAGSIER